MEASPVRIVCIAAPRLQPGMRLARNVLRADGAVLLSEGTELDEDELMHLHQRGIEFVYVALPDDRDAATRAADEQALRERIEFIFRPIGGESDARQDLKAAMLAYRLGVQT
jgi:hypothetical protein